MMIDYHFCGEGDRDKNAFVSVHWGLLPIDDTIRSLQRLGYRASAVPTRQNGKADREEGSQHP